MDILISSSLTSLPHEIRFRLFLPFLRPVSVCVVLARFLRDFDDSIDHRPILREPPQDREDSRIEHSGPPAFVLSLACLFSFSAYAVFVQTSSIVLLSRASPDTVHIVRSSLVALAYLHGHRRSR